jgi:hypothetical protein
MKKLIALFATTAVASGSAMGAIALSGSASVSYDDNGSDTASETSYDADLSIVGTAGSTTFTASYDLDGTAISTNSIDLATTIGPMTIAADMFNVVDTITETGDEAGEGNPRAQDDDTGVTVSLNAPVGDATLALDDSGAVTISGTWSGVTVAHNVKTNKTTGSAAIAGMDVSITNDDGSSTWSLGTTVSGVAVTLDSESDVSAVFGLAGNTMTVNYIGARASAAQDADNFSKAAVGAYSTVAISRALTSGATLAATYKSSDESLTLKASVAF